MMALSVSVSDINSANKQTKSFYCGISYIFVLEEGHGIQDFYHGIQDLDIYENSG